MTPNPSAIAPNRRWWLLPTLAAALLLAPTLTISPAWAGAPITQETSAEALRKELERYRVLYTEDHPDVQRMKRHLERAEQLEAEQRAEARRKAAAKKAREAAREGQQ